MSVSTVSMLFDGILACLLAVMIFYAVRLNRHILTLRERESEMQQMILQFNHSSAAAHASASALKSAGTEAEFGVKGAIAKARALQNDLELMIDRGNAICDRLDMQATVALDATRDFDCFHLSSPCVPRNGRPVCTIAPRARSGECTARSPCPGILTALSLNEQPVGPRRWLSRFPSIRSIPTCLRRRSTFTGSLGYWALA